MSVLRDPFHDHPESRTLVGRPEHSGLREFEYWPLDAAMAEHGFAPGWRRADEERDATRIAALSGHEGPLRVFACGSLMRDLSMRFDAVRVATAPHHVCHFCPFDEGTRAQPGLMAALDAADPGDPGCTELAFRIPETIVEEESRILWRREMLAEACRPVFIDVDTARGGLRVLAFLAEAKAALVRRDIPIAQQAETIAVACGLLGSIASYLSALVDHLKDLGLNDPTAFARLDRVRALQDAKAAD